MKIIVLLHIILVYWNLIKFDFKQFTIVTFQLKIEKLYRENYFQFNNLKCLKKKLNIKHSRNRFFFIQINLCRKGK